MKPLVLSENLVSALNRVCKDDLKLEGARGKVEGILQGYAERKRVSFKKLRVIDISDDRGNVQPQLRIHVESAPRLPNQSEKRYRQYITEKLCIIHRLIKAVTAINPRRKKSAPPLPESILLSQVPDYMRPLLRKLPKPRGEAARTHGRHNDPVKALTANGQMVLLALCRVDRAFDISREPEPINSLLVDHHVDIVAELRSLAPSAAEFVRVKKNQYRLLDKLNMRRPVPSPAKLRFKDWPQPLRDEYKQFLSLATGEARPSAALKASADRHKFSLKVCREMTITTTQYALEHAIPYIPHDGVLGIADLITLSPTEVVTEEGLKIDGRNPKVDAVLEHERAKCTPAKPVGYDSELSKRFLRAVKTVAARTGYGHLIKAFNKAYRVTIDRQGRQERKAAKKLGISRRWIDGELERLGAEYDYIVSKRLYERAPGRSKGAADRAMRLCLFYPEFLTMRQLGYRQQAIRGCVNNDNIKFLPDGTVVLHFPKLKVKNARTLHLEIKPVEDGVHERLRKVLITHHRKVLPYVQKRGGPHWGQQFFVHFDGNGGQFDGFDSAQDYGCYFKRRVREFLNVHELEPAMQDAIHPHFLRGVCTDWMILELKMTFEEAATVLGDTVAVLVREYLDRDRPCDATHAFDRVNKARRAERKDAGAGDSDSISKRLQELEAMLKAKDQVIEELTNRLAQVQVLSDSVSSLMARLSLPSDGLS